jgi:hypothetical protein
MSGAGNRGKTDTIDIPVLPINDLYRNRLSRDTARLKAYNKILENIYHKIRVTSSMPTHPTSIVYTIQPFILGVPRLDLEDCVVYLVWQLRNNGFTVTFTYPNMLGISWSHHEREYVANDSPIAQAMMATTPAPPAETKRGQPGHGQPKKSALKKNQGFGSAGNNEVNIFKMEGPAAPAAPLSAMDYMPPTGFLNAVERPAPAQTPKQFFGF